MKKIILIFLTCISCIQVRADSAKPWESDRVAYDVCDAKYTLAMDLIRNDLKYKKIDDATFIFLARRAMVALAACQYRAATANDTTQRNQP